VRELETDPGSRKTMNLLVFENPGGGTTSFSRMSQLDKFITSWYLNEIENEGLTVKADKKDEMLLRNMQFLRLAIPLLENGCPYSNTNSV
jgi:hypothetical protein